MIKFNVWLFSNQGQINRCLGGHCHYPSLVANLITVRYHWSSLTFFRAKWVSQDIPLYGH